MEIALTNGDVALIDDADFAIVDGISWHCHTKANGSRYAIGNLCGHNILMHRLLMRAKKSQIVDHLNRDGLDNRRRNLRFCTHTQNCMNRSKTKKTKLSGYKGVWKENGKWRACIRIDNRSHHLGSYETEIAAALAYNEAAIEKFGEYACVNEVQAVA